MLAFHHANIVSMVECKHDGSCLAWWNVSMMECKHDGMLAIMLSMECYHDGMLAWWNVSMMEC